ncbi:DUF397 domain-containing protein [Actinoplanes sp. NPDC051411]|uniref:DUF397 domain-containing protein n=1 Tax=Actinoplanes sp. NPDC051411 TaxID=3155522 RepID=UPI0034152D22
MADLSNASWKKSSRSANGGSSCVEVAITPDVVGVRDTKAHGQGPLLTFEPTEWAAFVDGVKSGEFDL